MPKPYYDKGRYLVRLGQHAIVEKTAGPQFTLRFIVLGRMHNGELQPTEQYERTFYRVINEKTADFAIEDIRSLGYDRQTFSELEDFPFEGTEVEMFCTHETYKGDEKEKWGIARQGGSTEIEGKRVDKKQLRTLDNLFGKSLKQSAKAQPQPAAAMATGLEITDDDVPF